MTPDEYQAECREPLTEMNEAAWSRRSLEATGEVDGDHGSPRALSGGCQRPSWAYRRPATRTWVGRAGSLT